jgi:hypothetical protein
MRLSVSLSLYAMLIAAVQLSAAESPNTPSTVFPENLTGNLPTPHWTVGDQWTVETVSSPRCSVTSPALPPRRQTVQWCFRVDGMEPVSGHDCFRVEVHCKSSQSPNQPLLPNVVLWLDRHSGMLRRICLRTPTVGACREVSLQYGTESGQPSPVLGPLNALPIDSPVFSPNSKGLETYTYETNVGTGLEKKIGEVGFLEQVRQHTAQATSDRLEKLRSANFAKSLLSEDSIERDGSTTVTEVRLATPDREIYQLWDGDQPWPVYCDNGYAVSRLLSIERVTDECPAKEKQR